MYSFGGLRIVTDANMTEPGPINWSVVRSPSRALRRQRKRPLPRLMVPIKIAYRAGDMLVMHPDMARELERSAAAAARAIVGADAGGSDDAG